uniref:Autophagy-related protein 2 n=1 Tax=Timema douglasi TaxID=61478 RepID=A0A7R8VYL8_TIMDO|nr:unnamed protein product [Timema douglasi]
MKRRTQFTLYTAANGQRDSDSDSEDNDGVYYSVYDHGQRQKRKQQMEKTSHTGQSKVAVTLSISQGVFNIYTPVRDSSGNVIPGQHGEIELQVSEGNLFSVSGYKGNAGLGFVCLQVNQADFYHNGLVTTPQEMKLVGSDSCSNLDRTIYRSDCGSLTKPTGDNKLDMLTVSIRITS